MNSVSIAQSEHRYFSFVAVAVTVIVLAGFIPLYTLSILGHDPNLTLLVRAHGFVMAAWIALFLTQTLLIARHRVDLHRRLGVFGVGLAVLVILVGVPTLVNAAARKSHDVHSTQFLWMLAAFDGLALVLFSGLVGAAILLRRRGDYHKRLMLLATLGLLGPAFGRLTAYGITNSRVLTEELLQDGFVKFSLQSQNFVLTKRFWKQRSTPLPMSTTKNREEIRIERQTSRREHELKHVKLDGVLAAAAEYSESLPAKG